MLTFINTWRERIAVDEFWPMCYPDLEPEVIGFCYVWCGTNVIGFYWKGVCLFGLEFKFKAEPSFSVIWFNRSLGFWFPED